jgi:superoxide dismutase, Fe-Mn family
MKPHASKSRRLTQTALPYSESALEPVLSQKNIDYHYGHLYRGYVDRYNNHEGDREFNRAGAFLHDIFFTQFCDPRTNNTKPGPLFRDLIRPFQRLSVLKSEMSEAAMQIQGSGWVYLSVEARVRTIANHQVRSDIALLIDWWEHAWNPDYLWRKQDYFDNIWDCINWDHIDDRLALL